MKTHKVCTLCGELKPRSSFSKKDARGGIKSKCKTCLAPSRAIKERTRYHSDEAYRERRRQRDRQRTRHGLWPEEIQARKDAQAGLCACCGVRKATQVDHDHSHCPGAQGCRECVRDILCWRCNSALGAAQDDVATLRSAISYLEKWTT